MEGFFLKKRKKGKMLDDKTPGSKLNPPTRGSSFYIENLLGTVDRGASAGERAEAPGVKVTVHSPVIYPGLETTRLSGSEVLTWSGTFPSGAYSSARSEFRQSACSRLLWLWRRCGGF